MMRASMRAMITASAVALGVSLGLGGAAQAQSTGSAWTRYPSGAYGWSSYAPGSAWGNPVPNLPVTRTAPLSAAATTTQRVAVAPPSGGAGWNQYVANAGRSWADYAPWTSYTGYTFRAGEGGVYSERVVAVPPSLYRELGTSRYVALSKPWLPNSY